MIIMLGLSPLAYWLSNFMWDVTNFIPPGLLAVFVAWLYDIDQLLGH